MVTSAPAPIRLQPEPMPHLTRRTFCALGSAATLSPLANVSWISGRGSPRRAVQWHDVVDWPIEGRAFAARKAPFDRLPAAAEGVVRDAVWNLSRHSAGMLVRLRTNSPELHVRYRLTSARLAMAHMPATGVSGVDLYGHDGSGWRWIDVTRPQKQDVARRFFHARDVAERDFALYLPLYNGVESLELGVLDDATITPLPRRGDDPKSRPILCYGTSIMHGACASRPGMAWPAIVGRQLDREVLNFGFSGNGRMETTVGRFLVELDPAVFVIDCLPNISPQQTKERTEPLVRQLREARPDTPILLVEDRTFTNAWFHEARREAHEDRRRELRDAIQRLRDAGVENLHLLAGEDLLGRDGDGATDGSHPNDLGMWRQANAVSAAVRPLLRA